MDDRGDGAGRGGRRGGALIRAVLRLALRAWPSGRRHTLGPTLLETSARFVDDARRRGRLAAAVELVGEAWGLVVGGVRVRWTDRAAERTDRGVGWIADARFALRTLGRSPGFTLVAVTTLALGVGANAAVFSLVDGVLLRPPPYERPDELVLVWNRLPGSDERVAVAGPDAAVVAERAGTLAEVAFTIRGVDGALESADGAARHVRLAATTVDFFDVLGASAALGRTFATTDGPGAATASGAPASPAVVLAHRVWRDALGADPTVVGRQIRLNGRPATVVGVMPRDFALALPPDAGVVTDVDVWVPLQVPLTAFHRTDERLLDRDSDNTGVIVARLAPGAAAADADDELERVAEELRAEVPAYAAAGLAFDVRPLHADATAHARPLLLALLAGVGAVLLVACLNIATLLVARGMGRGREFAVRASLGAGRGRLVRQLMVESAVLVGLGLTAALLLARGAMAILAGVVPSALGPPDPLGLDLRALAFVGVLGAAATVLFGLAPALDVARREGSVGPFGGLATRGPGRRTGRDALVVAEVGLSVVLVLCAGLLLRTVHSLEQVRPGFDTRNALTFKLSLRVPDTYRSPGVRAERMREITERLAALPGVRAVGLAGVLPLGGDRWTQPYGLPGQAESEWRANRADFRTIGSGYFDALGVRLLAGRGFTPQEDLREGERVVVVDEKLAARLAPDGSAVGAVLGLPLDGEPVRARVVGVVEHVRHDRLDADGREAVYVPYRQEASRDVAFVVRTDGDPAALAEAVRRAVRELDPRLPVYDLRTLDDYVAEAVAPRRFALTLLVGFAGLALLCAAIGLYGVVAFDVRRRTRDIGLRMAVGATRAAVVAAVLRSGLRLGAAGVAVGLLLAALVARWLRSSVYGVGVADPATWAGVVALVLAVTGLATWVPAVRASRLSPTEALRTE